MDGLTELFGTGATGVYLFGPDGNVDEMHVRGVRDGFVLQYEQLGRDADPILSRALTTKTVTHDGDVFAGDGWPRSRLYRDCGGPWQIKHYLCAPIVVAGIPIGTINLGRRSELHPFDRDDARTIATISTRIGERLVTLNNAGNDNFGKLRAERTRIRMQVEELERAAVPLDDAHTDELWTAFAGGDLVPIDMFDREDRTYVLLSPPDEPPPAPELTPREMDVVTRAAAGMANKEIAFELGISPNTVGTTLVSARRKLGVRSRVELIRRLTRS